MSSSDEIYRAKYLKYKQKYMAEKVRLEQSGGSLIGNLVKQAVKVVKEEAKTADSEA